MRKNANIMVGAGWARHKRVTPYMLEAAIACAEMDSTELERKCCLLCGAAAHKTLVHFSGMAADSFSRGFCVAGICKNCIAAGDPHENIVRGIDEGMGTPDQVACFHVKNGVAQAIKRKL